VESKGLLSGPLGSSLLEVMTVTVVDFYEFPYRYRWILHHASGYWFLSVPAKQAQIRNESDTDHDADRNRESNGIVVGRRKGSILLPVEVDD
jgi:hypothetical protein